MNLKTYCITLLLLVVASTAGADPLDRISGTETWKAAGPESVNDEWKEWYRARVAWRKARRVLQLERVRNARLARLMRKAGARPDFRRVRKLMRARTLRGDSSAPTAAPAAPGRRPARTGRRRGRRRGKTRDATPEPPSWVQVPVERLDDKGNAIDDEGDRVLRQSMQKGKR